MARRRSRTGGRASTQAVITGESELMDRLNSMSDDLKKNITKEALMAGAKVVKREMSAKARGSIAQSIEIEFSDTTGIPTIRIGPDKEHWYAAFQEFGAVPHTVKINSKQILSDGGDFFGREIRHPGLTKKPFVRPAIDDHEAEVKTAMMAVIRRRLGGT